MFVKLGYGHAKLIGAVAVRQMGQKIMVLQVLIHFADGNGRFRKFYTLAHISRYVTVWARALFLRCEDVCIIFLILHS